MKKIKINRNVHWSEIFINELVNAGVRYVCVSPGSRNTPLIYACVTNKKIKSFSIIDERSSGFFALGLAKVSNSPVVLVCTSGTAAAEFYPAIIEAYQSKIPLIVCTADRPASLRNTGANQTINQNNIYRNHILWFADAGLPKISGNNLWYIKNIARLAYIESTKNNKGPVHINFPFDEPLDPNSVTDEVSMDEVSNAKNITIPISFSNKSSETLNNKILKLVFTKIKKRRRGMILVGTDNYTKNFYKVCVKLSNYTGFPIFADAASNFRTQGLINKNILTHYDAYLRSDLFVQSHKPDFIIQFGRNFTSKALSNFIAGCSCEKLLVNKFGDWNNSADKLSTSLACEPETFCKELLTFVRKDKFELNEWMSDGLLAENDFLNIENAASKIKSKIFDKTSFPNETKIVNEIIIAMPSGSNLMVSNSLPIRDLDLILPLMEKKINIFHNRGASGIDGIISTALGIAKSSKKKTYLLTGDLAFYYDLTSLQMARKYSIPLTIILINNNGGRIFEMLSIPKLPNKIKDYFITPHDLDFKKIVTAFGGKHYQIKSWSDLKNILSRNENNNFSVLEIKTEPMRSLSLRKKYYEKVIEAYNHISKKLS